MKVGCFKVKFEVGPITEGGPKAELEGLVDTGAAFPMVPEDVLRRLGISPTREREFELADGSIKRFSIGEARFYYENYGGPCLVIFGPPGSEPLFGALALESLCLEADPLNQRLKPVRILFACAA